MKSVTLPGGEVVPSMGQGTWKMGERAERRSDEIAALRAGVELGMTLVDTAEMYGDGAAEVLICEALGRPSRRVVPRQQGVSTERIALPPCRARARRA
jgi:aryl-alcohol dehydrogenase-like predicted oxidoreductase